MSYFLGLLLILAAINFGGWIASDNDALFIVAHVYWAAFIICAALRESRHATPPGDGA